MIMVWSKHQNGKQNTHSILATKLLFPYIAIYNTNNILNVLVTNNFLKYRTHYSHSIFLKK